MVKYSNYAGNREAVLYMNAHFPLLLNGCYVLLKQICKTKSSKIYKNLPTFYRPKTVAFVKYPL